MEAKGRLYMFQIPEKKTLSTFIWIFFILFLSMPLYALDWVMDFDAGLEEALERGSPVFIFLCQDT